MTPTIINVTYDEYYAIAFSLVLSGLFMTMRILFAPPHEQVRENDDEF
jgi:hypothetical protein